MSAYYNENDPKAAAWLRELVRRDLIAPGDVDERSIADVRPDDLRGYAQCHFFAGIGGWSYALRLARWPDERPVWTGSCPCQPFSGAGKRQGYADERHLWPHWHRLIGECRPATIFGEQVASAVGSGWLDDVCLSLEALGYAVGALNFPACSVGAPHIRQRLYFVAERQGITRFEFPHEPYGYRSFWVADSERGTAERHGRELGSASRGSEGEGDQWQRLRDDTRHGSEPVAVADADETARVRAGRLVDAAEQGGRDRPISRPTGATSGFWRDAEWIACRDGKARAIEPGTSPLAHGVSNRVVKLRGLGNAIVVEQARAFIEAYLGK